jgi:hypothetical protein
MRDALTGENAHTWREESGLILQYSKVLLIALHMFTFDVNKVNAESSAIPLVNPYYDKALTF